MPRVRRSDPAGPGLRRLDGTPPRYRDARGAVVSDPVTLARIEALAIPPAWSDVWICADSVGHIQAVGTDQAGRRQYLYHDAWRQRRDRAKFDRALLLADSLASARRGVTRDLGATGFGHVRALAAAFRAIDASSLRIGGERYLHANHSRGLTTLLVQHVVVESDEIAFHFPAKSGLVWSSSLTDPALARFICDISAARGPRSRVFAWREQAWRSLTAAELNDDIRDRTGRDVTAKDFRTLHGTIVAAQALARVPRPESDRAATKAIADAVRTTAEVLGNTAAVARASYIDPRVFDRFRAGTVIDLRTSRSPERALIDVLES